MDRECAVISTLHCCHRNARQNIYSMSVGGWKWQNSETKERWGGLLLCKKKIVLFYDFHTRKKGVWVLKHVYIKNAKKKDITKLSFTSGSCMLVWGKFTNVSLGTWWKLPENFVLNIFRWHSPTPFPHLIFSILWRKIFFISNLNCNF